jgi:cytoskeletal protein RodZ
MTDTHDKPQEEPQEQAQAEASQDIRPALLAEIGQRLRQAREQRGLNTAEIARELKLRAAYLTAMENGEWSALPGYVYGIGFARQYARYLGLDLEEDIARISSHEYQLTKPLTFPDPPIAPAKRWAVTATLLFILLFIGFNVFHSVVHKPGQDTGPASLHPASPPPVAKPAAKKPKAEPAAPAPAKPAAKPVAAEPAPAPAAAPASSTAAPANASAVEKHKGAHRYRFLAVGGDVWLQLYSSPDALLKEALLRQGQHMDIDTDATSLIMDCGNAGALEISIDGKPVAAAGQLGPVGKVIRDYRLSVPTP